MCKIMLLQNRGVSWELILSIASVILAKLHTFYGLRKIKQDCIMFCSDKGVVINTVESMFHASQIIRQ